MTLSKNPNTYLDVEQVLAAARSEGGAVYTFESEGAASMWRRRAYTYRKLLAQSAAAAAGIPGFAATTKWDDMHLKLNGNDVIITFGFSFKGQLTSLGGTALSADTKARVDTGTDPLLSEALELAKRLGVDE